MSSKTTNYNMTLPAQDEFYDVDIFNENYEIVDENLKAVSDAVEGLATVASSGSYNDLTNKPNTVGGATVYTINSSTFTDGINMNSKPYAEIHICKNRIVYVGLLSEVYESNALACGLFLYADSNLQGVIGIQVNTVPTEDIKLVVVDLGAYPDDANHAIVINGLPAQQAVASDS